MLILSSLQRVGLLSACVLFLGTTLSFAQASMRMWKDVRGKEYTASILGANTKSVTLRDSRGVFFQLSRSQLSTADQEYIAKWITKSKKASSQPKPLNLETTPRRVTNNQPKPASSSQQRGFQSKSRSTQLRSSARTASNVAAYQLPWPKAVHLDINFPVEVGEFDRAKKRWVYRSPHFEFISNAQLGFDVVRSFAWMFEGTYTYCSKLPFNLERMQLQNQRRMRTYLFTTYSDYLRAGGIPNSAGTYSPGGDRILVPLRSLGVRKSGSKWLTNKNRSSKTLVHEIVHQLMRGPVNTAPWFIEGSAEYVSTIPFEGNRFLTSHHQKAMRDYIMSYGRKNQGGWALGKKARLPNLEFFMKCSYGTFQSIKSSYPYALMVFHYWAHMDGKGDAARLRSYVKALNEGVLESEARELLLDGRSWEEVEKQMKLGWGRLSMALEFVE